MKNLTNFKVNEKLIVQDIVNIDSTRLMELGFVKGTVVQKTCESIDKKMIGIKVKGSVIGIRKSVCESIIVNEVIT